MTDAIYFNGLSTLPDDLFELKGEEFFRLTTKLTSELSTDILKFQAINSAQLYVQTNDIFEFFQKDDIDFGDLKNNSCAKLKNGSFMIRPSLKKVLNIC